MRKETRVVFRLLIITICLVYIAFLKPQPQRYQIKEEIKDSKILEGAIQNSDEIYKVFDTATDKQYVNNMHMTTIFNLEAIKEPKTKIIQNSYVIDIVNNRVLHRKNLKIDVPHNSILGKRLNEETIKN